VPDDIVLLRQNDPRWGSKPLGNGALTIGRAGCLLTCMTMAANFLRSTALTPDVVNEMCATGGAFSGSFLIVEKAAEILSLHAPDSMRLRSKIGDLEIPIKIRAVLATRGIAIVHVDHDSALPRGGDHQGDHFVLTLRRVTVPTGPAHFECADPAPKAIVWLDAGTCTGTAQWGAVRKTYRAVGVIPIFKRSS